MSSHMWTVTCEQSHMSVNITCEQSHEQSHVISHRFRSHMITGSHTWADTDAEVIEDTQDMSHVGDEIVTMPLMCGRKDRMFMWHWMCVSTYNNQSWDMQSVRTNVESLNYLFLSPQIQWIKFNSPQFTYTHCRCMYSDSVVFMYSQRLIYLQWFSEIIGRINMFFYFTHTLYFIYYNIFNLVCSHLRHFMHIIPEVLWYYWIQ